jgi:hypothetical protein
MALPWNVERTLKRKQYRAYSLKGNLWVVNHPKPSPGSKRIWQATRYNTETGQLDLSPKLRSLAAIGKWVEPR